MTQLFKTTYSTMRAKALASNGCKKFLAFARLPELKACKTAGFLATWIF
tara:strand:+ start:1118 stop:1264 length:147 start_codon:yes stop_codon:yes gene_type:complete